MVIIIVARRRTWALRGGPAASCQMFVTSAGKIRIVAAATGAMTRLRIPIATVGSPMPTTPLTKPAAAKVRATKSAMVVESFMACGLGHPCRFGRRYGEAAAGAC